jgi:hypothetical protein
MRIPDKARKPIMGMVYAFVIINAIAISLKFFLKNIQVDSPVILVGNLLLFALAVFTLMSSAKSIDDPNPHAFVRSYYAGVLIRLAVIAVAAFTYIYVNNGNVNKAALFICMAIYAVYSAIEVSALRKILRGKSNA